MTRVKQMRRDTGLTQQQVCDRTGIARPNLSAYESGRRTPSPETVQRIRRACRPRPRDVVAQHRDEILEIVAAHKGSSVRVFGSVVRGEDTFDSDLDLLVRLDEGASLLDLVGMELDLREALGIEVDVVSEGGVEEGPGRLAAAAVPV